MKTCSKCKIEKPFEAFHKNKGSTDGYHSSCIECYNSRRLELKKNPLMQLEKEIKSSIVLENKLLKRENKRLCKGCKEIFLIDDLAGGYICKECNTKNVKKYREKNKEYYGAYKREYREKNKEKTKEYMRGYLREYRLKKKLEKVKIEQPILKDENIILENKINKSEIIAFMDKLDTLERLENESLY